MAIPKSKFEDWTGTGADKGSKAAADKVEGILRQNRSPVEHSDGSYEVRRQGSYKNDTHTYASSDVDVIAKLTSAWSRDLSELSEEEEERYHKYHSQADYGYDNFSQDVWGWLREKFDTRYISWTGKAIEISGDSPRIDVDVDLVPCIEHRFYTSYPEYDDEEFESGMAFEPRLRSDKIVNYPSLHYDNGTDKHGNYKETVRIFKNARDYYNEHFDTFWTIDAHSYGIECLIYNVPDQILKRSNPAERFDETLDYLEETDLDEFDQVSEMELLFGSSNTQWDIEEAEELIQRLREMWEDWYEKGANTRLIN